jgi:hypothetical protein
VEFGKGTRLIPVPKAVRVLFGISTDHGDEGEREHHEDEEHLANGEPKLSFSVPFNYKCVDAAMSQSAECSKDAQTCKHQTYK